jgi:nucleoside-diphosphate-sugar epimerase
VSQGTILFGGSGFLGPYILARDPAIISVGRRPPPTSNRHVHIDSLDDLGALRDVPFDKVIYIIGNTDHHRLEQRVIPPGEPTAFDYHVVPLLRTMEQLKDRPLRKLIHFSTVLIYDEKRITLPVSERSPIDPYRNRYVLSKYMAEEALKFYAQWIPIVSVRLANLYGPTPLTRYDLIHVVSRKLAEHGQAEVWSMRPARDFIYVDDAARAVLELRESDFTGTVNLGSGTVTPVRHVLEVLRNVSGGTIVDLDQPVSGPEQFQVDMTTMSRITRWKPEVSIEEGVRRTYEFTKRLVSEASTSRQDGQ